MVEVQMEKLHEQIESKIQEILGELLEILYNELNKIERLKIIECEKLERKKKENKENEKEMQEILETNQQKLKEIKEENKEIKEKSWAEIVEEEIENTQIIRKDKPKYGYCIYCRKGINSRIRCGEEFIDQKTKKKKYSCHLCATKKDRYEREIEDAGKEGYKINCHICGKMFSVHEKIDLNRNDKGAACGNECFCVYVAIGRYNKQKNRVNSLEFYIEKEIAKDGHWDSEYTMEEFLKVAEGYQKGEKITDQRNRPTMEKIDKKLDRLTNQNVERYVYDDGTERYNEQMYSQEAAEHTQKYIETGDVIEIIQAVAKDPSIKIGILEEISDN